MVKFKDFINEKQTDRKYELVGQEGKFWHIRALKDFECVDDRQWPKKDPKLMNK